MTLLDNDSNVVVRPNARIDDEAIDWVELRIAKPGPTKISKSWTRGWKALQLAASLLFVSRTVGPELIG